MNGSKNLFVYGTLLGRLGHSMHQLMTEEATLVGPATFHGQLFLVSGYPGAVPSENPADRVVGEVCELKSPENMFEMLDVYEGCTDPQPEFRRTQVTLQIIDGRIVDTWMYLYVLSTQGFERVSSGDFARFLETRDRS